jgi:hypothetical protein
MFVQSLCKGKTFIERNEERLEVIEHELEDNISSEVILELFNTKDLGMFDKVLQEKLFHERIPFPFVEKLFNHIQQDKITVEEFEEEFGYTRQYLAFMVMIGLM